MAIEYESTKIPSTVTIEASVEKSVIEVLDDTKFMLLDKASTNHEELFYYALALGWDKQVNLDVAKPKSGGFIRTESFSTKLSSVIEAIHYSTLGLDNPDGLVDHKEAYKNAEQFANGGFHLLEGELEQNKDTEVYANELIAEMNDKWNQLFEREKS